MCKEKKQTALLLLFLILIVLLCASMGLLWYSLLLYIRRTTPTVPRDRAPKESIVYEGSYSIALHLEQEKFSGELYYGTGSDKDGIDFEIVINSSYYTLRVTRIATGMDAINVLHPQSSNMTLTSIKNVTFMIMMSSTSQMSDYIVPPNATGLMETMMRSDDPRMTDSLFATLHNRNVDILRKDSLQLLAASREVSAVIEVVKKLARTNLIESNFPPAVRQFYLFGLQLGKMRNDILGHITRWGGCAAAGEDTNNDCYGVCADHDRCCEDKGFYTWACFRVGYNSFSSNCWDNLFCL
uniref:Uncharacterized protein n=1 Tax=Amphimedon queenslandica TaxID=400682 RepID=A0A1X7U128_AMPQE